MKKTVYIDMDGTIADFIKAYKKALKREPGIIYPQSQMKFFEDLEIIEGAKDAYFALKRKYNVFFLTRPSIYNPMSYTEKRLWIEKHFGLSECDKLIMCCDKTLVRGDYLIDDLAEQSGQFKPEWEQIVFGSEKYPDWVSVLKYLLLSKVER